MPRKKADVNNPKRPKWDDTMYVRAYRLACGGLNDAEMAKALGIHQTCFMKWRDTNPAFAQAVKDGRDTKRGGIRGFMKHVSGRLPLELQELWDLLCSEDDRVRERACASVKESDTLRQQHLFMHAYMAMNFMQSRACEATGIRESMVIEWKHKDKRFKRLLELVDIARGDFYENALVRLVESGDAGAIIFANRTFNAERGYDKKVTVKVQADVQHRHSVSLKDLSPEVQRAMLEDIRRRKAQLEDRSKVQDADFEVKKGVPN